MKKVFYPLLILGLLCFFLSSRVRAQVGTSQYFLNILPQANVNNPAFIAPDDFYFGFPALSNVHAQLYNNFLSWDRMVERGSDDSLRFNVPKLLGKIGTKARIGLEVDEDILRFGFRRKENYFHVGLSLHANANVVLTKKTLDFLLRGPGQSMGNNDLSGNSVDINSYAYLYFGYARKVSKMVTVGGRVKILNGLYNFNTKKLNIHWAVENDQMENPNQTPYTYVMNVDGVLNTNLPLNEDLKLGAFSLNIGKNWGLGLDFGVSVNFAKGWNFSASVLDLGFISWKSKTSSWVSINPNLNFPFQGLSFDFYNKDIRFDSLIKGAATELLDTLGFKRKDTKGYTTALPSTLLASFCYTLSEKHQFGVVFKGQFYNHYFDAEFGIAYTYTPCKNFAVSVNNTFCRGNALNFGIVLVGNLGPVQLHLGVDRINSFNIATLRTVNVNFGINFLIGKQEIFSDKIARAKLNKMSGQPL